MKYKCKDCGEIFEAKWDVVCPKCGGHKTDVIYQYSYPKATPADTAAE